jgi:hypothetical protein
VQLQNKKKAKYNMRLTILEAYKSMIEFLDVYYQKTNSDDLGGFLGGIDLTKDNSTMDPAAWCEWLECLHKIQGDNSAKNLTLKDAYKTVIEFLNIYYQETESEDVGALLSSMALIEDERMTNDPEAWQNWIKSVEKVLSQK